MTRTLRLASLVALLGIVVPGVAVAHEGAEPWIHVPAQGIEAGQTFELWGADLGDGAAVAVEIVAGERTIEVGRVTAEADGHFTQTLTLPAQVPDGYAQLHAISDAGVDAFMWVLVGQNADGAADSSAADANQWWSDPSVIVLVGMLGAALVAVVLLAFRAGRRSGAVRAPVAAGPLPRKNRRRTRRGSI